MVIKIKVVYLLCQTTTTGRLPRTIKRNQNGNNNLQRFGIYCIFALSNNNDGAFTPNN
nr:MAG TPA: hypothetical protein [Caudoviricetes sp.]